MRGSYVVALRCSQTVNEGVGVRKIKHTSLTAAELGGYGSLEILYRLLSILHPFSTTAYAYGQALSRLRRHG